MSRLVFMLEEPSLKTLLDELLPRLFPGLDFFCIAHEGKNDLEKSVPRKLRAWAVPGDRFVVVRDNDGSDCVALKARLVFLCQSAGRADTLIRIVCQELDAWYLGKPDAIAAAFDKPGIPAKCRSVRFRNPDSIPRPSNVLNNLCPRFQKVGGARMMAAHLSYAPNCSQSFRVLIEGVARITGCSLPT
jgi:Domain of unknown function (DUF4276)